MFSGTVPKDSGAEAVLEYLRVNLGNENCVKQALQELVPLSKEDPSEFDASGLSQ